MYVCHWKFALSLLVLVCTLQVLQVQGSSVNGVDRDFAVRQYDYAVIRLTRNAKTDECKSKIMKEYHKYLRALSTETYYPFEATMYHTECPGKDNANPPLGIKVFPPPPKLPLPPARIVFDRHSEGHESNPSHEHLKILYVLLVHNNVDFVQQLVHALNEPQHTFVIHVDLKAADVHEALSQVYAPTDTTETAVNTSVFPEHYDQLINHAIPVRRGGGRFGNVWVMQEEREACNWGGFSIVNATLNAMRLAVFTLQRPFDYCMDVSGTSYPIKTNNVIKKTLAERPGAIYIDVVTEPQFPQTDMWNHMVECDDAIHRIARLTLPKGFHIHVASQWWTLPRHVIEWFISDPLPIGFMDYAQHYIVADENYFATMILNSPYCGDVVQKNHVMVMFDKWENDLKTGKSGRKDRRKCLHPYPDHCGRSPTTLTMQDVDIVRSSKMLFARKFDVSNNSSLELVNYMDEWRARSEQHQLLMPERDPNDESSFFMLRLRTNKTVAAVNNAFLKENGNRKLTATDNLPGEDDLCMAHRGGLADRVTLEKCDSNSTLQYFTLDGCEGNSFVTLRDGQSPVLVPHPGVDTATARPRIICQFIMVANQLCLDINGQNYNPGADMIGWECSGQWNQLFEITPDGMMLAHLPPTLRRIRDVKAGSFEKLCMQGEIADGAGGESAVKLQECIEYQYNASMNMINVKANPVLPGSKSNLQFDSILRTGRMMTYYLPKTKPKDAQQLKQSGRSEL